MSGRYLFSEHAVPNILKDNPDARFIVMLRNPIDMAHSSHSNLLHRHYEDESSFQKAWELQETRAAGERIPPGCKRPKLLLYRHRCSFAPEIERLFKRVRRDHVLVHVFEEFFADPRVAYKRTLTFLGLSDDRRRHFERVNEHGVPRSWFLHDLARHPPFMLNHLHGPLKRIFQCIRLAARLSLFSLDYRKRKISLPWPRHSAAGSRPNSSPTLHGLKKFWAAISMSGGRVKRSDRIGSEMLANQRYREDYKRGRPIMPRRTRQRQDAPKLDFCIIGASKSGKSALYTYLRTHPKIFMPEMDSNFYVKDGKKIKHTFHEIFGGANNGQLIGEASGRYLFSERAVPNILKDNPHARFIIMVRNPVNMAQSRHCHFLRRGYEDEWSFQRAWDLQDARAAGERIPPSCPDPKTLLYRDRCSFAGAMERLFQWMPRERVLVHVFEEFFADPRAGYQRTLAFLDLPHDGRRRFERINELGMPRNWLLHNLAHKPPLLYRMLKRTFNVVGLQARFGFFPMDYWGERNLSPHGPNIPSSTRGRISARDCASRGDFGTGSGCLEVQVSRRRRLLWQINDRTHLPRPHSVVMWQRYGVEWSLKRVASALAYDFLHEETFCFGDQALLCPRRNLRPCAAG